MSEDRPKRTYDVEHGSQKIREGRKKCSSCHQSKFLNDFWKDKHASTGFSCQCKSCKGEKHKQWRDSGGGIESRTRAYRRRSWKQHGININIEEYDNLFSQQKGKCAICGRHQSEMKFRLAVDHNHTTGLVRGLLCNKCNFVVAAIESNGDKIEKAKSYIKDWSK